MDRPRSVIRIFMIILMIIIIGKCMADDFTNRCQPGCSCSWKEGNKVADCTGQSWNAIPIRLNSEIQILNLTGNPLGQLMKGPFRKVISLKKLILKRCNISHILPESFYNLQIMSELDLSENALTSLEPASFHDLPLLTKLLLNNNRISHIKPKTFQDLPKLTTLNLSYNRMTTMQPDIFENLPSLSTLVLHNNPWNCDCTLKLLKTFLIRRNIHDTSITCAEPHSLKNRFWSDVELYQFACKPIITYFQPKKISPAPKEHVTISCEANGNPPPEISWLVNKRPIDADCKHNGYIITTSERDYTRWAHLTILTMKIHPADEFTCVAKNIGGFVKEVSVVGKIASAPKDPSKCKVDIVPFTLICVTGCLFVVDVLLIFHFLLKRLRTKNNDESLENDMNSFIRKKKSLNNTLPKPRRKHDTHGLVSNSMTESSDINNSLIASNEDVHRSIFFIESATSGAKPSNNLIYANPKALKSLTPPRSVSPYKSVYIPAVPSDGGYVTIPKKPELRHWDDTYSII